MRINVLFALLFLAANGRAASYFSSFPNTEAPLSEGGRWIQGQTSGLNWRNVNSLPGFAFGSQTGQGNYDDSTAVLAGSWGSDQTAQATAVVRSPTSQIAEVELRLRTTIAPNRITGYEFNYSIASGQTYCQIVRWNGALGSFTLLDSRAIDVNSGDVVKATAAGNTLTTYVNGRAIFSVVDSTFKGGSPGVGFYVQTNGINQGFGLTNFSAQDSGSPPLPTPAPTPTPTPPMPYAQWENALLNELRSVGIRTSQINSVSTWLGTHPPVP